MSPESEQLQRYIAGIVQALVVLTSDEESREDAIFSLPSFDMQDGDMTLFITAIPYAVGIWIRGNTQMQPNHLEVTHLLNSLVHQYEKAEAVRKAQTEAS